MKTLLATIALAVAVDGSAAPEPSRVRTIAATCAACHGTDGAAVPGQAMAPLAGYSKAALVAQMKAFRDGTRAATVMHQIARGYSDDEIDALATWFAAQPAGTR